MRSRNSFKLFAETKKDFKNSWHLFKENYRAFLSTEFFAFLSFITTEIIMFSVISLIYYIVPSLSIEDLWFNFSHKFNISHIFTFIIIFFSLIILFAFLNCQNGLAYDIMSSGEMFAEFKSSFTYFRRYWWQYFLLTILILMGGFWGRIIFDFSNNPMNSSQIITLDALQIGRIIILFLLFFIWFVIFINTLPSITAQGSLKHCFIESYRILRKNAKRLFITWGFFFLIFIVPPFTIIIIIITFLPSLLSTFFILVLLGLSVLFLVIIGFPMLSLIATGIYNNAEFTRFKPFPLSE